MFDSSWSETDEHCMQSQPTLHLGLSGRWATAVASQLDPSQYLSPHFVNIGYDSFHFFYTFRSIHQAFVLPNLCLFFKPGKPLIRWYIH